MTTLLILAGAVVLTLSLVAFLSWLVMRPTKSQNYDSIYEKAKHLAKRFGQVVEYNPELDNRVVMRFKICSYGPVIEYITKKKVENNDAEYGGKIIIRYEGKEEVFKHLFWLKLHIPQKEGEVLNPRADSKNLLMVSGEWQDELTRVYWSHKSAEIFEEKF